jgi:hypothetical protein
VKPTFQPEIADEPVFVIVRFSVIPVFHELTESVILQPLPPVPPVVLPVVPDVVLPVVPDVVLPVVPDVVLPVVPDVVLPVVPDVVLPVVPPVVEPEPPSAATAALYDALGW